MLNKSERGREGFAEILRFVANGLIATAIHFVVLNLNISAFKMHSAGMANFFAALVGITASFVGNRYYVFRGKKQPLGAQTGKFILLYGTLAVLQGAILFLWTDCFKLDYRLGFVLAVTLQVVISFFGNKRLVFKI
jgi:putative flippase GtrA